LVKIGDIEVPEELYYSKDNFWVRLEKDKARVGLTDYAQQILKSIVYADLPRAGTEVKQSEVCGSVESVKAVADLMCPLSGKVSESNGEVEANSGLINDDPYQKGWLFIIEPSNLNTELTNLMDFNRAAEWHKTLADRK